MSSFIVRATEPTALSHMSTYTLPLVDMITAYTVEVAHVVPGPIDIPRFRNALARTLALYPLASGRLRSRREATGPWQLDLTNRGVPVVIVDAADARPLCTIVQRPLALVQSLSIAKILASPDEPLMRVKITRLADGGTAIGVSTWHPLGDGNTVLRMMRHLSQTYLGLPPLDPPPVYEDASCLRRTSDLPPVETPCHNATYPIGRPPPLQQEPGRVDFRLTARQLHQLRDAVTLARGPTKHNGVGQLSRQDCLVALLARCISTADDGAPPIDTVYTLLNGRGTGDIQPSVAGNALIWATAAPLPGSTDLRATAQGIRASVLAGRDADFVDAFTAAVGERNRQVCAADHALDVAPEPGSMTVNSSMRFDWTSAHFGYPGQTRFYHTAPRFARYVKIFKANPDVPHVPGAPWRSRTDDAEVALAVSSVAVKDKFRRILSSELRSLGVSGAVEWVEP